MQNELLVETQEYGQIKFSPIPETFQDLQNELSEQCEKGQWQVTAWNCSQSQVLITESNFSSVKDNLSTIRIFASIQSKSICQVTLEKIQKYFNRFRDKLQGKTREIFRKMIILKLLRLRKIEIDYSLQNNLNTAPLLTQLKSLTIRGSNIDQGLACQLFPKITCLSHLNYLRVSEIKLSMSAVYNLTQGLQGLNELREIQIFETLMGPAGLIALADNFPLMPNLQILDLHKNYFGSAAASKFRLLFSKTPGLIELNLSQNNLRSEGCNEVSESLRLLPNLKVFLFRFNDLSPQCCKGLSKSLVDCIYLQTLDLCFNKLKSKGCLRILKAVKKMRNMNVLDIRYNDCFDQLKEKITQLQFLKRNLHCKGFQQAEICDLCGQRCGQLYCSYARRRELLMLRFYQKHRLNY